MPSVGSQTVGYQKKKSYKKKNYKPKPKAASAGTATIARVVKKIVDSKIEDKLIINSTVMQAVNVPASGLTAAGAGALSPITPLISQGITEATRIGNKVFAKKLWLRYTINALPTTEAGFTNPFRGLPFFVRVVVYRHRYNLGDSSPDALVNFNNTTINLDNNVDTYFRPYNRDEYQILYSATHKMAPCRHLGASAFTDINQDSKMTSWLVRKVGIAVPKVMRFNDNNATPTNFNAYIGVAVCNVDGSVISGSQTRCTVNCESNLYFQDA